MKALIGFKAFYFFSSVSVGFRCVCEMAFNVLFHMFCIDLTTISIIQCQKRANNPFKFFYIL